MLRQMYSMDEDPTSELADFSKLPKDFVVSVLERLPLCDVIAASEVCHQLLRCYWPAAFLVPHARYPAVTDVVMSFSIVIAPLVSAAAASGWLDDAHVLFSTSCADNQLRPELCC